MGIVLFDWETPSSRKKVDNALLVRICLFDGYLTQLISYSHFGFRAYLTEKSTAATKKVVSYLISSICLFDGHLTETPLFNPISQHFDDRG